MELDGDTHGPMAAAMLDELASAESAAVIERAAIDALATRRALWDGVLAALDSTPVTTI